MDGVATFPQRAGELMIPARSETPSRSAASSRTGHPQIKDTQVAAEQNSSAVSAQNRQQSLQIVTDIQRGAPGDPGMAAIAKRTPEQGLAAKQRSHFYTEVFSYRESAGSAKDRAGMDSVVMAEVKTNVIVKDEYTFLTGLSSFLSQRYNRPESSVLITLAHSTCLLLSGSFDPAYLMTITALPALVGPTTNKRNAALIQTHMTEELRVPPERGVLRFAAIDEASLATNGTTVLADIESKSKTSAARNYPPAPASPRSFNTEHSGARSFFSKKASKKSLKEQPSMKLPALASTDRPKDRKSEKQRQKSNADSLPDEPSRQQSRVSALSSTENPQVIEITEGDDGLATPPKIDRAKSRTSSFKVFGHSRKASTETDEKTDHGTAPTSLEDEQARIAAMSAKLQPPQVPMSPLDEEAEKRGRMGKRKSFMTMFSKGGG